MLPGVCPSRKSSLLRKSTTRPLWRLTKFVTICALTERPLRFDSIKKKSSHRPTNDATNKGWFVANSINLSILDFRKRKKRGAKYKQGARIHPCPPPLNALHYYVFLWQRCIFR